MIDTDNVKGGYCSKQEMIFYLNAVEEVKRLREGIVNALIPTETRPIIHPLVKLGDLRNALKEMIE